MPLDRPPCLAEERPDGLDDRKVHDPFGHCKDYDVRYFYSAESRVTRELASTYSNMDISCLSDVKMITDACSASNRLRIIKLGRLSSFKEIGDRGLPLVILQKLCIFSQIFAISNFYFKVELLPHIDDVKLAQVLREYNKAVEEDLFHSCYNGTVTTRLHPLPNSVVRVKKVLIIENPPMSLRREDALQWVLESSQASDVYASVGESERAKYFVFEGMFPASFHAPEFAILNGLRYQTKLLPTVPNFIRRNSQPVAALSLPDKFAKAVSIVMESKSDDDGPRTLVGTSVPPLPRVLLMCLLHHMALCLLLQLRLFLQLCLLYQR